ncbi:hypothetical protein IQ06DRAFT_305193 [Phaeosphaeriaceae sp. SRC1lsM3a]|nr:hypothetical protein IQ06DRAFT_305193 [Stagonospora sp. SRC1lsM3a]
MHCLNRSLVRALFVISIFYEYASAQVDIGTAKPYGIIAAQAITNTGDTVVDGLIGIFPNGANSITGFPPGLSGGVNAANAAANIARNDAATAYAIAASLASTGSTGPDLGGQVLTAGVYTTASSVGITGALVLDGQNNPNAVFVFQIGSTLTSATASSVILINGAQACNVFWQVGSSATLGTATVFVGNILALTSITVNAGVTVGGGLIWDGDYDGHGIGYLNEFSNGHSDIVSIVVSGALVATFHIVSALAFPIAGHNIVFVTFSNSIANFPFNAPPHIFDNHTCVDLYDPDHLIDTLHLFDTPSYIFDNYACVNLYDLDHLVNHIHPHSLVNISRHLNNTHHLNDPGIFPFHAISKKSLSNNDLQHTLHHPDINVPNFHKNENDIPHPDINHQMFSLLPVFKASALHLVPVKVNVKAEDLEAGACSVQAGQICEQEGWV